MNDRGSTSLLNLIYAGETDTLELKAMIREPQLLARLIGSIPIIIKKSYGPNRRYKRLV